MREARRGTRGTEGGGRSASRGEGPESGRRGRGRDATAPLAPATGRTIRVLLADDHTIVRQGIKMILSSEPDIEVVGEAENGREAVEMAKTLEPDVAVLDISMPGINGIEATRRIKAALPNIHTLALSMHADDTYVFQVLKAGGSGYVLKGAAATDLVRAIHAARRGEAFLYPALAKAVVADYLKRVEKGEGRETYDGLTDREREILVLIAEGATNEEIKEKLYISVKTVQTHRTHIMEKLGLHDRTLLVRYAVRKGLIDP